MKKIKYLFILCSALLFAEPTDTGVSEIPPEVPVKQQVSVTTRGDIKIIEASENIRYMSQKMVKDYLLYYINQDKSELKINLETTLQELGDNLRTIATITKDNDTKDILEFLAYSKDQIEEIFSGEANDEKVALMLDYSETLLEGADSIANAHMYDFSEEEKMLMVTKKMEYLLERIAKYYMAINGGFDTATNKEQLLASIESMEENIKQINEYKYNLEFSQIQREMNFSWKANKSFFMQSETLFIPVLIFASVNYMEEVIGQISLYHIQNL